MLQKKDRLAVAQNDATPPKSLAKGVISKSKLEEGVMFERQRFYNKSNPIYKRLLQNLNSKAPMSVLCARELAVLESQRQLKELQSQVVDVHSEIAQTKKLIQSLQFQLRQQ